MIVEYIRYKLLPEKSKAFVSSYKEASEQLNASLFCNAWELTDCEEDAGQFILRIEWTSITN